MKARYVSLLYLIISCLMAIGISGFSIWRNKERSVSEIAITFEGSAYYLNDSIVNKLLIQKWPSDTLKNGDALVLKAVEDYFKTLTVVENAEVFQYPEGVLGVKIKERRPLFRVAEKTSFYVDASGNTFPISDTHTFYVPVFLEGFSESKKNEIVKLVHTLLDDEYVSKELSYLYLEEGHYVMGLRSFDFKVAIGTPLEVENKLRKLKTFCAYQQRKETQSFSKINLEYKNQIIATF